MAGCVLELTGTEGFAAAREALFNHVTNVDTLATTIPDLVSAQRTAPGVLSCTVKPGFSFLRGTLKLRIELGELTPPKRAVMTVDAAGIGVAMRVESDLQIDEIETGSRLLWTARVTRLEGLIASIPKTLLGAAAQQVIKRGWERVREGLADQQGPTSCP